MSATQTPALETRSRPQDETAAGFHQSWFPLALASELGAPVLDTIRFRPRVLVASDRHLAHFFKFVREFPRALALDA